MGIPTTRHSVEHTVLHALIESGRLSSQYSTRRYYQSIVLQTPQGAQWGVREDILSQGWSHSPAL